MKNLLLILALFVGSSFAEDEYPIELTCEIGEAILYVSVEKIPEKTWIKRLPIGSVGPSVNGWKFLNDKKNYASTRKNKFLLDSEYIFFAIPAGGLGNLVFFEINRLSGKLKTGLSEGDCINGFKEYGERKF